MAGQGAVTDWEAEKVQWLERLRRLTDQIAEWAKAEGWLVSVLQKDLEEEPLGAYRAPTLHIRTANGNLVVDPVARNVIGADGRVDLMAFPSLDRILLIHKNGEWKVVTDSRVSLPIDWTRENFIKLADALTHP